ncbi:MAG: nucleoside kinase [Candidatus Marinimicrobia bacterium]|nr:nucleoside kinase [Candidatus Neomarinimicrobiota bacterium]MBL7060007.1 nucleoside kinase [Candidatus Neomarinimicrobiota bacterium]
MHSKSTRNTLVFLLAKAFNELFAPRQIVIEHSFSDGLFCHEANWEKVSEKEIRRLEKQLHDWINDSTPIELETCSKEIVLKELVLMSSQSKLELLHQWDVDPVPIVRFGQHWDLRIGYIQTEKRKLDTFNLMKYNDGFLIRFHDEGKTLPPFVDQPQLFSIIEEHERWGSILGVSTIRKLNEIIRSKTVQEMIWVAEGLHEKKISDIADKLVEGFPGKKLISIAGPSSSGKTTFAKRLGIQLRVNGFKTAQISMDNYFINREDLKPNDDGELNFETIDAVNVELLSERINQLLSGNPIPVRKFDFMTGKGRDTNKTIQLGKWDFVLLEGIHGLNPVLTKKLGEEHLQRIYISAITQMNIDANHRISTSDNRLLRRIVRDHKFRGYSVEKTIERWASVRIGEEKNIFPFQEEADIMFNSSLVYEIPVIGKYVCPLLKEMNTSSSLMKEAQRLKTLLSFFEPLDEEFVPGISILREFIGSSDFNY